MENQRLEVKVYVEGYEDVAFWRSIFDRFDNPYLRFEITVPERGDLPKGKKVLMQAIADSSEEMLLCVDSDFDYLFAGRTEQSRDVLAARYMFHTYAYATENYLCYAPSLHNVCVKATKNDTHIFDFVEFMSRYSEIIYPLFIWYAFSAQQASEHLFPLTNFKQSVKINYLDTEDNGRSTLEWLERNVEKRCRMLERHNAKLVPAMHHFEHQLRERGLKPESCYLFMHGHTLMDNVVMVLLNSVCARLRDMSLARIHSSQKRGIALKNEISNYQNSLRSIRDVLLDNENYTRCPLYMRLQRDIVRYISRTIIDRRQRGLITGTDYMTVLRHMRELIV